MPRKFTGYETTALKDAPLVVTCVSDGRATERIGYVVGRQIYVRKSASVALAENYFRDFLYKKGFNTIFSTESDGKIPTQDILNQLKARALFRITIFQYHVEALNVFDEPTYEVGFKLVVVNPSGAILLEELFQGQFKNFAIFVKKAMNESLGKAFDQAMLKLDSNEKFKIILSEIKNK